MLSARISLAILYLAATCSGFPRTAPAIPEAAQPSVHFDAAAATNAYLATVAPSEHAKSDAYFEGGYWLLLWDTLYASAVMLLLLETGLSARLRATAQRSTRFPLIRSFIYWCEFAIATALMTFPLTVYEGFFREHKYGLSNQTFGSWFRDEVVGLVVALICGGIAFAILMAVVRRWPRTWHIWGALVAIIFAAFAIAVAPVFVAPLFNTYKPLQNTPIKDEILSLARQNGIPAIDVYEVDASKQSKRVSANVSGAFGTERITLNDNLLNRCSPEAILAVMGHEMGHYVMHHMVNGILFAIITIAVMFAILRWALNGLLMRRGQKWGIGMIGDDGVLPVAVLILTIVGFFFTPAANTFTRTQEYEADIFGLNSARQPDGEAEADLLLGEYRKLDPTPLEEFLFYDHPSGRTRIYAAMRWKAENLCLFNASLPCANAPSASDRQKTRPPSR